MKPGALAAAMRPALAFSAADRTWPFSTTVFVSASVSMSIVVESMPAFGHQGGLDVSRLLRGG